MRTIGLYMIISAIVIFIITMLFETSVDPLNLKHVMYLTWLMGFGQLLVLCGIGFILYDIAAKHGISEQKKPQENRFEEKNETKNAVMICPGCNKKSVFPQSVVGSTVECPHCKAEVIIENVQEETDKDVGVE